MPQNEEGSRTEWIYAWVLCVDYPKERERKRETSRKIRINNNIKKKEKNGMYA